MMFHHLGQMLSDSPGDPINLLIVASTFRDSLPWLYELGMEAYRSNANPGSHALARKSLQKFIRAFELLDQGPFSPDELGIDPRTSRRMAKELQHMVMEVGMSMHRSAKTEKKVAGE